MTIEDIALSLEAEEMSNDDALVAFADEENEDATEQVKELIEDLFESHEISDETRSRMLSFLA